MRMKVALAPLALVMASALTTQAWAQGTPQTIDTMDNVVDWPAKASDSVTTFSKEVAGTKGKAVQLAYDFGKVSGYAFIRRPVEINFPHNYELRFKVRGTGGRNDFQVKLTDASGDNVWWHVFPDFRPSGKWQEISIGAGDIEFAWGPIADKTLRKAAAMEFVVARNRDGGAGTIEIDDVRLVPLAGDPVKTSAETTPLNDELAALAKAAPRGEYPRAYVGEQPYWTLAGSDGGVANALISEDGAIEPYKGSFSLEPFVFEDGKRFDWSSVTIRQSLEEDDLPIPSVEWTTPNFRLDTTLLVGHDSPVVMGGYRLTNISKERRKFTLLLAARPMQVNPPRQFLSQRGGASRVESAEWTGRDIEMIQSEGEGDPKVTRIVRPSLAPSFAYVLGGSGLPGVKERSGVDGVAGGGLNSGAMFFEFDLAPGERKFVSVAFAEKGGAFGQWDQVHAATKKHWRETLDRVAITVPQEKQWLADTVQTSLAHILMSRQGPMLKPGTRSYNRAWIRDGAMIGEGLLRLGRPDVAREFSDWYRGHLFDNGKVPCCVDFRGADPVPENDSQGEYIFLATELYRYTGDKAALEKDWSAVLGAVNYMDELRLSERTPANQTPDRQMLYGLMPPSISHEGYSAKAQYSLWDDFWALRGYKDAADVARWLGKPEAGKIAASRDQFAGDLHKAILASAQHFNIDYIPGATSLGDFDATSTTIGLDPGGEQSRLDPKLLNRTFETYWERFIARRDGKLGWNDYTPYELRNVSAFIRLGWRDRADALLEFFKNDRRPQAWNQWAEVVGKERREIRFIGDMPHAWISSDYIRAALDMFAYEDHDKHALVLGAGFDADWLIGEGVAIKGLATPYGSLDFGMRGNAAKLSANISSDANPPGGFILPWPFDGTPPSAKINGKTAQWQGRNLPIKATGKPIQIEIGR